LNSLALSLIAFACVFGGTMFGMWLRALLPDHHLSEESQDVVKLGTGMIATLAALVLALLISSAKTTFDTMNNEIMQAGSKLVLLDRVMAQYGPETTEARDLMRRGLTSVVQRFQSIDTFDDSIAAGKTRYEFEEVQNKLQKLSPRNDAQRWIQSRALQISADISAARWLLYEQTGESALPVPFLVVLVCWLTIIFASFGLYSPRNATVFFVLLICAISVAAALFLILELDRPYFGLVKISTAPLQKALAIMGQ